MAEWANIPVRSESAAILRQRKREIEYALQKKVTWDEFLLNTTYQRKEQ